MGPLGWLQLVLFMAVTSYAIILFVQAVTARVAYIRLGRSEPLDEPGERVRYALGRMFGHGTLLKDAKSGIMHLVIFYGFLIVQFGALELVVQGFNPAWHWPLGETGYRAYALSQEAVVLFVLAAVLYAFHRRYIERLPRLKRSWKAGMVLLLIGGLMLSVIAAQAFRLLYTVFPSGESSVQPLASRLANEINQAFGIGKAAAQFGFYAFWWTHLLLLLGFLVYVPQSKHAHFLFAPFNLAFRRLGPPGKLSSVDLEDETAEEFGVGAIEKFTRNQLTDLYACVECGRCTSVCPASATGKTLSPMALLVQMRDHLTRKGAVLTARSPWVPTFAFAKQPPVVEALIGDIVTEAELWACTTCRNCEDQCPVGNEHVSFIVDMRRFLVMNEGRMPAEAARTLTNIERQGNPWGISRRDRALWRELLGDDAIAPLLGDRKPFDYLLFVGSMGSYDKRSSAVTRAFVTLMNRARIPFAVIGAEEGNSGDTARRLGNDYLYRQLAEENIEKFVRHRVKRIVTIDPHAYNTFKHEYLEFGLPADVQIFHHTELLARWLDEGKLQPMRQISERIVYHDSCYLGRYNDVYSAPRAILLSLPGATLLEMERSGTNSMCCGAGGGLMWLEETEGKRIGSARAEQALATGPTVIGTACPYCLSMLGDGTKQMDADERVRTMDVAELLLMSLE